MKKEVPFSFLENARLEKMPSKCRAPPPAWGASYVPDDITVAIREPPTISRLKEEQKECLKSWLKTPMLSSNTAPLEAQHLRLDLV